MRHAVPKSTETRADKRAGRVFIDLAGPFHVESLAGSRFAMLCVDDFSRYKIVAIMAKKSDATAVLRAIIAKYFAPAGLNIGVIRTDNGGEFKGAFQSLLAELGIKHERTPPYTPQYNGVAERTLGLLRDKTVALLRGVTEGASERLWAEAMAYACDMSNKCVTDSLDVAWSTTRVRHPVTVRYRGLPARGKAGAQAGFARGQVHSSRYWRSS